MSSHRRVCRARQRSFGWFFSCAFFVSTKNPNSRSAITDRAKSPQTCTIISDGAAIPKKGIIPKYNCKLDTYDVSKAESIHPSITRRLPCCGWNTFHCCVVGVARAHALVILPFRSNGKKKECRKPDQEDASLFLFLTGIFQNR